MIVSLYFRHLRRPLAAGVAALLLGLTSCSPSSGGGSKKQPSSKAFTVKEAVPTPGSSASSRNVEIRVTFSDGVDFATVSPSTFEVRGSSTGSPQGSYAYNAPARRVSFLAAVPYAWSERVEVRLTGALRSASGVALTPAEFSFTILSNPDVNPPPPADELAVESTSPGHFATDVPLDATVSVRFNRALDPASVTAAGATVSSAGAGTIPATMEPLADGGRRLTIVPQKLFLAGDSVTVTLPRSIKAADGAAFAGDAVQFRTRAGPPPAERSRQTVFSALGTVKELLCADLNLDRLADAVYTAENETVIDVLLGRGDGTFIPALRIDAGQSLHSLQTADLDADGDIDLVAGTSDRARVYFNRAVEQGASPDTAQFEAGPEAALGFAVRGIAAGDIDHSGAPDLVLDTDRGLHVYLAGLGAPASQVIGNSRQARTRPLLSDIDLDGHLDLVFGDRRGNQVTYYLSRGPGMAPFGDAAHVDIGTDADELAVEDLDQDASPEIIVLIAGGGSAAAFRVLRRTPGGYEVTGGAGGGGDEPGGDAGVDATLDVGRFAVADVDGDGALDVILAQTGLGKVVWFRNSGGQFAFNAGGDRTLEAPEPLVVRAADLTNDGSIDLVVGARSEIHTLLPKATDPPPPPIGEFELTLDPVQARQKDHGANLLVRFTNTKPIQGYSIAFGYDAAAVAPTGVDITGTATGSSGAEFTNFAQVPGESAVTYAVLVDMLPPFEAKTLPAGENQLLFRLIFDVHETAPLGQTSFDFLAGAGTPRVETMVIAGGVGVVPETSPGTLTVLPPKGPPPTGNRFLLTSGSAAPGARASLLVLATARDPVEAFTVIIAFDSGALEAEDLAIIGSETEALRPELVVPNIENANGFAALTVIFDLLPPFERQTIPPGADMHICTARMRARDTAAPGPYSVRFENQLGTPPLNNILVTGGQSLFPELVPGELTVGGDAEPSFLRGDFTASRTLDLSDAVALVNHLFKGGPGAACDDAADVDDSGRLDLSDSVRLLDHLFGGGPPLPAPFPGVGPDPTPDSLGCDADS